MSAYTYLPWVRQGLSGTLEPKDLSTDKLLNRVTMDVVLRLNRGDPVEVKLRLYGPGDVVGFDARQVIRAEPKNLSQDFEPNYFPFIEFDRPDFPWLLTPASANAKGQLRPWICLVVVEKSEGKLSLGQPLPLLQVNDVRAELPDLDESWAWAYAEVLDTSDEAAVPDPSVVKQVLASKPAQNLSRLVCARKLEPQKTYYACVVPVFRAGVLAGLGEPVADNDPLETAWSLSAGGDVQLPVYYHWEFSTGRTGDFEALVWRLERQNPASFQGEVGSRPMAVPHAGDLGLEGALRLKQPSPKAEETAKTQMQDFSESLLDVLNAPGNAPAPSTLLGSFALKPPIYGQWHGACKFVDANNSTACPQWLYDLNVDPRQRAAAAVGTRIVQDLQEQLMASAWEQVEAIERANQFLRQAQLARSSAKFIHGRLSALPATALVCVTAPTHARLLDGNQTVYARLGRSPIPVGAFSGSFRRAVRSGGPVSRKTGKGLDAGRLLERLNNMELRAVEETFSPPDMTAQPLSDLFSNLHGTPADLSFIHEAKAQFQAMRRPRPDRPGLEPVSLESVQPAILGGLDPEITITDLWKERIDPRPPGWRPADELEPIMAAPEFPTAMYKPLLELSQDLLFPGLGSVPPETITFLSSNPRFIRAYMVGLNHEMSRELLWREFPTDQRGTYFRQFWDSAGAIPVPRTPEERDKLKDIAPITDWDRSQALDGKLAKDRMATQTVLLIRGELLRRYPNTIIYATQGRWVKDANGNWKRVPAPVSPETEKYPSFVGTVDPDITFMSFDLDPVDARGWEDPDHTEGAGWFLVIQQPPTEPRYGLDETAATTHPQAWHWTDLAWSHVARTPGGYVQLSGGLKDFPDLKTPSQASWGRDVNSADLAFITLQRPLRLLIHASDLLPAPESV